MWAHSALELGKIMAAARRHRKLTQGELAKAVGATQAWISEIERGKETAQIGKIFRVLSYLGVRLQVGEAPWIARQPSARASTGISLAEIIAAHSGSKRRNAKK